jgi:hypothetical protein
MSRESQDAVGGSEYYKEQKLKIAEEKKRPYNFF